MITHPLSFFEDKTYNVKIKQCFVIMPFTESWSNRVYETLQAACLEVGYGCIRADDVHGRLILQDIWQKINESGILIADLTGNNPNVFYELGIAHTLGKDVVPIIQLGSKIPFDQTPFRTIHYDLIADGLSALQENVKSFLNLPSILNSPVALIKANQVNEFNAWKNRLKKMFIIRDEDFSNLTIQGIDFSNAHLSECNFENTDLVHSNLVGSRFIRANFAYSKLDKSDLSKSNVSEAVFVGASLVAANLAGVIALRVDLSGARLESADTNGMTIDKATYLRFQKQLQMCKNFDEIIVEN